MIVITPELLATLMQEFREKLEETIHSIDRPYTFPEVENAAKVVIGMRRTGKTYFLLQEIRQLIAEKNISLERILYLNFEDDRILPANKNDLARLLETFYALHPENHDQEVYFFLDEIQNVSDWPIVIRRFIDTKKTKIYLTGSSSKMLSKDIATSLRGRSFATEMWPYSFTEYLNAHQYDAIPKLMSKKNSDLYLKYLRDYLVEGGFPAVTHSKTEERRMILQDYVDTVVFRDIVERYKISNITLIKYLVKTLLNLTSCDYSPNKIFNDLKSQGFNVSKDTIYDYIKYIEDSFLAFSVPLYSDSLRKTQVNPKKNYSIDSGLVNAYTISFSPNFGRMFENQFYIDLRRKKHDIYYYKTKDGYGIDFFTRDLKGAFHLYQLVWDISDNQTLTREKRALKAAEEELGIKGELIDPSTYLKWLQE